ncbi:DUF1304 domain-containing protein [Paraglaciecola sp.]|uniref:DUF1304 domain-containing protein n=1 Tax=Paraglaciecola sp. TaxID=1920173 RepID=UPI0030F47AB7
MKFLAGLLTFTVALLHLGFMALEMFFWNAPLGHKIFGMSAEVAATSEVLAFNQGLYNGILAVGLLWGLMANKHGIKVYFLLAIIVAGVVGGLTAKMTIMYIQALPALLALLLVMKTKGRRAGEPRLFS